MLKLMMAIKGALLCLSLLFIYLLTYLLTYLITYLLTYLLWFLLVTSSITSIFNPASHSAHNLPMTLLLTGPMSENQVLSHCLAFESMGLNPHFDHRNFLFRQIEIDPDTGEIDDLMIIL